MALTKDQLLAKFKTAPGITGDYQDEPLSIYIDDVQSFMSRAGVSTETIEGEEAVGVIARGVSDLWNYGSGSVKLSEFFIQRVIQFAADHHFDQFVQRLVGKTEGFADLLPVAQNGDHVGDFLEGQVVAQIDLFDQLPLLGP